MGSIKKAMRNLNRSMSRKDPQAAIPFDLYLKILCEQPEIVIRNVFQVFHDMIKSHVGEGIDEYPDDPESINYVRYDFSQLFVDGSDRPFFVDRLFANRFINQVESLRQGAQQNKIYIIEGPPGCGKSTFLNNLLRKFEEYTSTPKGMRFETVWRLDPKLLGGISDNEAIPLLEKVKNLLESSPPQDVNEMISDYQLRNHSSDDESNVNYMLNDYIEIPCPSHDNPFLMIPKRHRRPFLDDLFKNDKYKWKLFTEKEYEWVFKSKPCTICSSLYKALLHKVNDPEEVYHMIYARPYNFNRRLGEGISVFNPGDKPMKQYILTNPMLQKRINNVLRDSNQVKYLFSQYAKTNNGIYALMDIKSHNTERLIELHNIISEGIHKVEDIEENVNSLFLALMNPEDKPNIQVFQSFSDRIEYISLPYVMDVNTEVEIYRNIFGKHIDGSFLPKVLNNFARVIISTRLNKSSDVMLDWIGDPAKYNLYCDSNLQLLKMEIYRGKIPTWLTEKDRKQFTAQRRKKIIAESLNEGKKGYSGRDSIRLFNKFYSTYAKEDRLINMSILIEFFTKIQKTDTITIPEGFLESLQKMYDYSILQEVKEALYYYNEEQISKDIKNYLFSVNFDYGSTEVCTYTGEKLEITEHFLESIENRLLGRSVNDENRYYFREDIQREYASKTLTQEILMENIPVEETELFKSLQERYIYNLKEKVLDPFLENENFRRAIKDYEEEAFKTYDKRIRDDVTYLMTNLGKKFGYTKQGAKEVCIYVIDNNLAKKFSA